MSADCVRELARQTVWDRGLYPLATLDELHSLLAQIAREEGPMPGLPGGDTAHLANRVWQRCRFSPELRAILEMEGLLTLAERTIRPDET